MTNLGTYFYDTEGNRLGSESGILPLPLFKGMQITFSENPAIFHVVEWSFHLGLRLEEGGLRIVLQRAGERNGEDLSLPGPDAVYESQ